MLRCALGLGSATDMESLTVYWPDGKSERFPVPALRRYTTLVEGKGIEAGGK